MCRWITYAPALCTKFPLLRMRFRSRDQMLHIRKNTQNELFCQTTNSDELALGMKRWLEVHFISPKNIFLPNIGISLFIAKKTTSYGCVVGPTHYTSARTHKISFFARLLTQMNLLWVWKGGLKCTLFAWKIFFAKYKYFIICACKFYKSSDDAHLSYEGQTVQTSCPRSLVSFLLIV